MRRLVLVELAGMIVVGVLIGLAVALTRVPHGMGWVLFGTVVGGLLWFDIAETALAPRWLTDEERGLVHGEADRGDGAG